MIFYVLPWDLGSFFFRFHLIFPIQKIPLHVDIFQCRHTNRCLQLHLCLGCHCLRVVFDGPKMILLQIQECQQNQQEDHVSRKKGQRGDLLVSFVWTIRDQFSLCRLWKVEEVWLGWQRRRDETKGRSPDSRSVEVCYASLRYVI